MHFRNIIRMISILIAAGTFVSCGKIFQGSDQEIRPAITYEQRASWQSRLWQRYGRDLPSGDEYSKSFASVLNDAAEKQTYGRLVEIMEEEAIFNAGMFIPVQVQYALHAPMQLSVIGTDMTGWSDRLASQKGEEQLTADVIVKDFVSEVGRLVDIPDRTAEDSSLPGKDEILLGDLEENIMLIAMATINRIGEAFADIPEEEITFFLEKSSKLLEEFVWYSNVSASLKGEEGEPDLLAIAKKLKYAQLTAAMKVLAEIASPEMIERFKNIDSEGEPAQTLDIDSRFRGNFVFAQQTPIGLVLIGDRGKNIYGGDAAIIIDLGGDDIYTGNVGASIYEIEKGAIAEVTSPLGVVVDLAGNDRYISTRFASTGAGFVGLGLLVDLEGDDVYMGDTLSLGAGFMGIGCLVDMVGNDTYSSKHIGQGAAIFGAGLLFDGEGNDLFSGAKFVQGVGGPDGAGYLVDLAGDDQYVVGGQLGSGYGTRKIFQGYGQGLGWGFRDNAAGGLGVLHDLSGNDIYEAGNFAQGTGYYFGLGLLRDGSGDDKYWGSRYCQGSAAHQAVGIMLDDAGDDLYSGQIAANQGAAWDISVAGFYDHAGDDVHMGADLSLGAAEQNGIAFFYEGSGKDIYITPVKKTLGFGGRTTYSGGRDAANIGIFFDTGGQQDFYLEKAWENDSFSVEGNIGIFVDK